MCCFGLAAMSLWFAFERWIFNWHDGHKLLSDALKDAGQNVLDTRPVAWSTTQMRRAFALGQKLFFIFGRIVKAVPPGSAIWGSTSRSSTVDMDPEAPLDPIEAFFSLELQPKDDDGSDDNSPKHEALKGRERFIDFVNRVIERKRAMAPRPNFRRETRASRRQITDASDLNSTIPSARVNELVPKLKDMSVAQRCDYHTALVRDIQFSPDGKLLATSRYAVLVLRLILAHFFA